MVLLLLCFLLMFVVGELACRLMGIRPYKEYPPPPPYNHAIKDAILGWKMTPNYTYSGKVKDLKNEEYEVSLQYDKNGFKTFGDPSSDKKKVFFIGDSYTAAVDASNEKTYYNLLKDSLDLEIFAYGQSAWGTFQEYLLFKEYVEIIQPDLVVWQTTSNDFIDNYAPLEMEANYQVGLRRPYLTADGNTIYIRPISLGKKIGEYSAFLRFLNDKWTNIGYNYLETQKKKAEYFIINQKKAYLLYAQSVEITNLIFDKIKDALPDGTQLIGFSADLAEPQISDFKTIFNSRGFKYTLKPVKLVNKGEWNKEIVFASDGYHWNHRGQELIAEGLLEIIQE